MSRIFVSYKSEDGERVARLAQALQRCRFGELTLCSLRLRSDLCRALCRNLAIPT
jgi:hypothetical protein